MRSQKCRPPDGVLTIGGFTPRPASHAVSAALVCALSASATANPFPARMPIFPARLPASCYCTPVGLDCHSEPMTFLEPGYTGTVASPNPSYRCRHTSSAALMAGYLRTAPVDDQRPAAAPAWRARAAGRLWTNIPTAGLSAGQIPG